ncbi:MAG TPA: ABC transporter ATP-binding protein [Chloroflexota bacterium]|nr:ABC transporter ATP-binding protein [Chloroflexota bacterium]
MRPHFDNDQDEVLGKAYDGRLVRRLVPFITPYKRRLLLATVLLLLSPAFDLAGPWLTKLAIDQDIYPVHHKPNPGGLGLILVLYLLTLAGGFVLRYFQNWHIQHIGQHVMFDLRNRIFSHLQRLPLQFFDTHPVGSLITRMTNDIDALNDLLTEGLVSMIGDFATLAGVIIIMLLMNWQLALVALAVLPVVGYVSRVFQRAMRVIYRSIRVRLSRVNAFLNENITGMVTVQLFNRESTMFEQFDRLNSDYLGANLRSVFAYSVFMPIVSFLGAVSTALLIWVGGHGIISHWGPAFTLGALIAASQYTDRAFQPIRDLADTFNTLQAAMASSERLFGLLDQVQEPPDSANPVVLDKVAGKIEFRNVKFGYKPEHPVLRDVSFTIQPGESVAIVGATGAGKTSLISILSRFYDIQEGQILLDGVDIREMRRADVRKHIGAVLQDAVLFSGTITGNIRLHNTDISDADVRRAAVFVNADKFIEQLPDGYDHVVRERGANFSAGQRQLISFARAIAFDPEVLLVLDEATSSVDTETEALIQEALERLMQNRTSIIIAHRLFTIRHVDRILVLHKGRLVEEGTHEELLNRRGYYHRLYQLQYQEQEAAV